MIDALAVYHAIADVAGVALLILGACASLLWGPWNSLSWLCLKVYQFCERGARDHDKARLDSKAAWVRTLEGARISLTELEQKTREIAWQGPEAAK